MPCLTYYPEETIQIPYIGFQIIQKLNNYIKQSPLYVFQELSNSLNTIRDILIQNLNVVTYKQLQM